MPVTFNATGNSTSEGCGDGSSDNTVMLGITIGLISSVAINLGQNIQALGAKEAGADQNPCSSRRWVIGFSTFAIGAAGNMVAMAFASAMILVPLESSQFVTNIFYSRFVNRVRVTARQWAGTVLAVVGTTLSCLFGPNQQQCFDIGDFERFWSNPVWVIYVIVTFSLSAMGWVVYVRLHALSQATDAATSHRHEATLAALYALSSALIGGAQMIVHTKAVAELVDMVFAGEYTLGAMLCEPIFWIELAMMTVGGFYWLRQMNNSLASFDPLFIIPLLQASYITFGSAASGIFYQEFDSMGATGHAGDASWGLYALGLFLVIIGLMLLAPPGSFEDCCATSRDAQTVEAIERGAFARGSSRRDSAGRERSGSFGPGGGGVVLGGVGSSCSVTLGGSAPASLAATATSTPCGAKLKAGGPATTPSPTDSGPMSSDEDGAVTSSTRAREAGTDKRVESGEPHTEGGCSVQ